MSVSLRLWWRRSKCWNYQEMPFWCLSAAAKGKSVVTDSAAATSQGTSVAVLGPLATLLALLSEEEIIDDPT